MKRRVALDLLALNLLLFVPGFVFRLEPFDLLPFTPKEHPHGAYGLDARSAVEYVKALLLRRANLDIFRVSVELAAMTAVLVVTSRLRAARLLPWLFGAGYALLLLFLTYHRAYEYAFLTEPAVWEDAQLAVNLLHYLADRFTVFGAGAAALGLVAAVFGVAWLAARVFTRLRELELPLRARAFAVVLAVWGGVSLRWFTVERDDPVMQLAAKRVAWNFIKSAELRARGFVTPDLRYDAYRAPMLTRRPRVHLVMVEAYGQRLATDWQMSGPFKVLAARLDEQLAQRGLHVRTGYSSAPVFGGRSWLSIATVMTGIFIDRPTDYTTFLRAAPRITTLVQFFRAQGYRTFSLQPGNKHRDLKLARDVFYCDQLMDYPELRYDGVKYGWGWVPDQYALSYYREQVLSREAGPYFSFFMSTSTHHPWPQIPWAADWRAHNRNEPAAHVPWSVTADSAGIDEGSPRNYFESVVYEWRALLDFIDAEAQDDTVFIVLGDHQPLLEHSAGESAASRLTPLHVISKDRSFVDRFERYGLTPGLFAERFDGSLKHEGLFSLLVFELTAHFGTPAPGVEYLPGGISQAGLSVR